MVTTIKRLLMVVIVSISTAAFAADDSASAKARFLAANPDNGWEYGYLDQDAKFVPYNTTFDVGEGIAGWALDHAPGIFGDVTVNYSDVPIDVCGLHWEPGQVCVNAALAGQGTVVRWHATSSASVRIDTELVSQTTGVNVTARVVVDGNQLTTDRIGKSPAYLTDEAQQTTADSKLTRSSMARVTEDSTVDFIVSLGNGGALGHVSTSIVVNTIGQDGTVLSRTSPGIASEVARQAQLATTMARRTD